jgi:hypothetical protein
MALTSQIVTVTASVAQAPTAPTLQQAGAFVSVGGTSQTTGTLTFCANAAAVTAILSATGNFAELTKMATTYFAQGTGNGVYVLELGASGGVVATQIGTLVTYVAANPGQIYAYLLPATWDASGAAVNSMAATYSSPTGMTYFFSTSTTGTISAYTAVNKANFVVVPSPTAAGTEFQTAAFFAQWLANNPTAANPMKPMNFRFLSGVTPWALTGVSGGTNNSTVTTLLTAFVNVVLNGAEGGISNALIRNGTTMDGNAAMFWWAVDWVLIQSKVLLANAVINGSNGAPLPYNQFGINTLQTIANNLVAVTGTSESILLNGSVTAVPFVTYTNANPSAYAAGSYGGLAATVTPQLGFQAINFFLTATTFA